MSDKQPDNRLWSLARDIAHEADDKTLDAIRGYLDEHAEMRAMGKHREETWERLAASEARAAALEAKLAQMEERVAGLDGVSGGSVVRLTEPVQWSLTLNNDGLIAPVAVGDADSPGDALMRAAGFQRVEDGAPLGDDVATTRMLVEATERARLRIESTYGVDPDVAIVLDFDAVHTPGKMPSESSLAIEGRPRFEAGDRVLVHESEHGGLTIFSAPDDVPAALFVEEVVFDVERNRTTYSLLRERE